MKNFLDYASPSSTYPKNICLVFFACKKFIITTSNLACQMYSLDNNISHIQEYPSCFIVAHAPILYRPSAGLFFFPELHLLYVPRWNVSHRLLMTVLFHFVELGHLHLPLLRS
jgi:hypothetical protein